MKKQVKVHLKDEKHIKDFFNLNSKTECDIDVEKDHSFIDGKSLLGVMSMNLSNPLKIFIHGEDNEIEQLVDEYASNDLIAEI